jgi:hypothetical protein
MAEVMSMLLVTKSIKQTTVGKELNFLWGDGRTQDDGGLHAWSFGTSELNKWYHLVATYKWDGSNSMYKAL